MFNNFHDAFLSLLEEHLSYDYYNVPRNQAQYEKIMTSFELSNPIERVVYSKERKVNIIFQIAEFLWYLSGDNSLDFISYYSSNMRKYSMDGKTLTGTAYGIKLMNKINGKSELEKVIELLKDFPDTKRAVLQIYHTSELFVDDNIDVSCTLDLQFLLRNNKLNLISYMRANDMYIGMVSDVFSFTMLQEFVANVLCVDVGNYYHIVGSSHIYELNFESAKKVVQSKKSYSSYELNYPQMPKENPTSSFATLLELEKKLRKNEIKLSEKSIQLITLDKYYLDIIRLLELKREIHYKEKISYDIVVALNPTLKYLFMNRYGDVIQCQKF